MESEEKNIVDGQKKPTYTNTNAQPLFHDRLIDTANRLKDNERKNIIQNRRRRRK